MSRRTEPRPNLLVAALACAALLACSPAPDDGAERAHGEPAPAESPTEGTPAPARDAREARPEAPGAGVKAYLDPETGRLRAPTAEDLERERLRLDRAEVLEGEELIGEPLPGGGVKVRLQGAAELATVATIAEDGTIETRCETVGEAASAAREDGHE